jgi:hypothetical protein
VLAQLVVEAGLGPVCGPSCAATAFDEDGLAEAERQAA